MADGADDEQALREGIIENCLWMNAAGLNQGTSGNISARCGDRMLVTPSSIPYEDVTPEMIASVPLSDPDRWEGPARPSSEWRFHLDILNARPDVGAIVHTHSTFATVLSMTRRHIPAVHYMIAVFGGPTVRCADFALFGTQALSDAAITAMKGRNGCLLANHGMIAAGPNLKRAMWLAVELETLAKQYWHVLQLGDGVVLSDEQVAETAEAMKLQGYGG